MADGVWRTIKGRHVYIRKGESLKDAINKRKNQINENRAKLELKTEMTRSGYYDKQVAKDEENEWYWGTAKDYKKAYAQKKRNWGTEYTEPEYLTSKGTFTKDINKAVTISADAGYDADKKFENARKKGNINSFDVNDVKVRQFKGHTDNLDEFVYRTNQVGDERIRLGLAQNTFNMGNQYVRDAQIDYKALDRFNSQANTIVGGNRKSFGDRAAKAEQLKKDLKKYYEKNPAKVDESSFKKIDRPLMQDALNDLYLTQVQSENADLKLKEWKSRANANTPGGRRYRDIVDNAKGGTAKEQIYKINNTDFYEANGYMARLNYYPESDRIYSDVYNLNKRDEMSYPDVYDTYDSESDSRKYGVNWSAMGTMTPKDTKTYAERLNNAANFAESLNTKSTTAKENFKQMNTWQIEEMFIRQGYSEETARKMAKEYLNRRKRK